ncbi:MAG TPA: lipopolysaccharide kinase InaA family protein [Thermodesulfobacteriota bacterium]|nr:lipopolysaccharide kinase InaA family protein [Thermodesulfobacteriota bacterium]
MSFERVVLKGWRVVFDGEKCPAGFLDKIEAALQGDVPADWAPVESSSNASVWKIPFAGKNYVFKEYLSRGLSEALKARIKGTRAERAWANGRMLLENGFPTPPMLLWGMKAKRNFLVTEFIPDACGLFEFLNGRMKEIRRDKRKRIIRTLASTFGEVAGRLHSKGIIHGDLRLNNVLLTGWNAVEPIFYFIDNERNSIHKKAPLKLIKRNLVQLNMIKLDLLSRSDRLRFFRAYIRAFPAMADGKKTLAKEVCIGTEQRMKKYGGF